MANIFGDKLSNIFQNPFNDPLARTNTTLSQAHEALAGDYNAAQALIDDGSAGIKQRKERMKGADNDVIESLAKMQLGGFCDFNTKMGEFMERLMRINLNEHNITLNETGFDAHDFGDQDSLNYNLAKSYSYTKGNNYIEDFVKPTKKEESYGIDATQKMAADGPYMQTTNLYPDDITGAGTGDFRSYEKWAVKNKNSILYKTKQLFRQKKINTIISRFGTNADGRSTDILYKGSRRTNFGESHGRNLLTKDAENGGGGYNINGYNNPYCRVWTHHYKYDRLNKTIRPFSGDATLSKFHSWGNGFENDEALHQGKFKHVDGFYYKDNNGQDVLYNGYSVYKNEKTGEVLHPEIGKDRGSYEQNIPINSSWKAGNVGWNYSVLDTSKGGDGLLKITPKFGNGNTESNIHPKDCMFSIENLAWKGYDPYSFENALSWEQRGPLGGRIMWFPPYGIEFNESTNVNWSRNSFIGRGEDVYTYVNTQRTGNLSFLMVVDHPSIIDYATWNTNAPQPSETDVLRFFAGCDDGEGSDSLTSYVQPTPLTDEGVNIFGPNQKTITNEQANSTSKDVDNNGKGKDTEKTNITVKVMAFYPNNYSGAYDDWDYTFGYLLMGTDTWTGYTQTGNQYTAKNWYKDVNFEDIFFKGNFKSFEDEIANTNENENAGKSLNQSTQRGYECNRLNGVTITTDESCQESNTAVPCQNMIYAYKQPFEKAYAQFKKEKKGIVWHYRVDGEYKNDKDSKNTYNQRIPGPGGKKIWPNENYKDTKSHQLNLETKDWQDVAKNTTTGVTGGSITGSGTDSNSSSSGGGSSDSSYIPNHAENRTAEFWDKYSEYDTTIDFTTFEGIKRFLENKDQKLQEGKKYKFLGDSGNSTDITEINLKNRIYDDFNDCRNFTNTTQYGDYGFVQIQPTIRDQKTLEAIKSNIISLGFESINPQSENDKDGKDAWKKYSKKINEEHISTSLPSKNIEKFLATYFYDSDIKPTSKNNDNTEIVFTKESETNTITDTYQITYDNDIATKIVKDSYNKVHGYHQTSEYTPYEYDEVAIFAKLNDPIQIQKNRRIYLKSTRNGMFMANNNEGENNETPVDTGTNIPSNQNSENKDTKPVEQSVSQSENNASEKEEEVIYCSLNDFIAAMDSNLFKIKKKENAVASSNTNKVPITINGTTTTVNLEPISANTSTSEYTLQHKNYFYERSNNKETIKKLWNLFKDSELLNFDCVGYSNSHGATGDTSSARSKENNTNLAQMRARRLAELIEHKFEKSAQSVGSVAAKPVTGDAHSSLDAKLWRSALATLKFNVATKDDIHSSQSIEDEKQPEQTTGWESFLELYKFGEEEIPNRNSKQGDGNRILSNQPFSQRSSTCNKKLKPSDIGVWKNARTEMSKFGINVIPRAKIPNINCTKIRENTALGCSYCNKRNQHYEFRLTGSYKAGDGCTYITSLDWIAAAPWSDAWKSYRAAQDTINELQPKTKQGVTYEIGYRAGGSCNINAFGVNVKEGASTNQTYLQSLINEKNRLITEYKKRDGYFYTSSAKIYKQEFNVSFKLTDSNATSQQTNQVETKVASGSTGGDSGSSSGSGSTSGSTEQPNNQATNAAPVSQTQTDQRNRELQEMQRKTREAAQKAYLAQRKLQEESYKQDGTKIVEETVLTRITPDYMLRYDTNTQKGDKNVLRYDQEYYFFKSLEKRDKIVYDKLMDKIKYFDPAFHSMTPEGFNARLTFLNQCTRQGNTISISDRNTSDAGNIDKSVKTANNLAFGRPPYCVLRLGDFYNQMIVINSINIDYSVSDGIQWDMNAEGIGMQPLLARVSISFNFIGGSDMAGPVRRLQNAMTFNYYANARYYDNRADRMSYPANENSVPMGAVNYQPDKEHSTAYVTAMRK